MNPGGPVLKLDKGQRIDLREGRSVECFPVVTDGSFLLVYTRPGKNPRRPIRTRLRLSEDAFLATAAMAISMIKTRTQLALAAAPKEDK